MTPRKPRLLVLLLLACGFSKFLAAPTIKRQLEVLSNGFKPLAFRASLATKCLSQSGLADLAALFEGNQDSSLSAIAAYAFLWGAPLVENVKAMKAPPSDTSSATLHPVNTWIHQSSINVQGDGLPSASHLTSKAFLDLSAGPLVLTLPIGLSHHFMLTAVTFSGSKLASLDNTNTVASWLLVGPGFTGTVPKPFTAANTIRSDNNAVRLQLVVLSPSFPDISDALAVQDQFGLKPLTASAPAATALASAVAAAVKYVELASPNLPAEFFYAVSAVMKVKPLAQADKALLRSTFSKVGLSTAGMAAPQALSKAQLAALAVGYTVGAQCVTTYGLPRRVAPSNPWSSVPPVAKITGGEAAVAKALQAAVMFADTATADWGVATYAFSPKGLMPSYMNYTLVVPKATLSANPWALAVYNRDNLTLAVNNNPSFRLLQSSTPGLQFSGTNLNVYVSISPPSKAANQANWLPAPLQGRAIRPVLRVYATVKNPKITFPATAAAAAAAAEEPGVKANRRSLAQQVVTGGASLSTSQILYQGLPLVSQGYNIIDGLPLVASTAQETQDPGIMGAQVFNALSSQNVNTFLTSSCNQTYNTQSTFSGTDYTYQAGFSIEVEGIPVDPEDPEITLGGSAGFKQNIATSFTNSETVVTSSTECTVGAIQLQLMSNVPALTNGFIYQAQQLLAAWDSAYYCPYTVQPNQQPVFPSECTGCTFYPFGCSVTCASCSGSSALTLQLNDCQAGAYIEYANNALSCATVAGFKCPIAQVSATSTQCTSSLPVGGSWSSTCTNPTCSTLNGACSMTALCQNNAQQLVPTGISLSSCQSPYSLTNINGQLTCVTYSGQPLPSFQQQMETFMNVYGTHLITTANLGGVYNTLYSCSAAAYSNTYTSSTELSFSVTAGMGGEDEGDEDDDQDMGVDWGSSSSYYQTLKGNDISWSSTIAPAVPIPLSNSAQCNVQGGPPCVIDTTTYTQTLVSLVTNNPNSEGVLAPVSYTVMSYGLLFSTYTNLFLGVSASTLQAFGTAFDDAVMACQQNGWCSPPPATCVTNSYPNGSPSYPKCTSCSNPTGPNCYLQNTASCTSTTCNCNANWWTTTAGQQGCATINQGTCAASGSKKIVWNDCTAPFNSVYTSEWSADWHCKCCPVSSSQYAGYQSYGCGAWTS